MPLVEIVTMLTDSITWLMAVSLLFASKVSKMRFFKLLSLLSLSLAFQFQMEAQERNIISALNALTYQIANQHDHFYSLKGIRTLTIVHLAAHDIVQSSRDTYHPYLVDTSITDLNVEAAIFSMARIILTDGYPDRKDTIEQVISAWIETKADMDESLKFGRYVAEKYLQNRYGDGHEKQGSYTPMSKPGDYQYTEGWDNWVFKPDFDYAKPFSFEDVSAFRVQPPPALTSPEYTRDFNEIVHFGRKASSYRSKDQTHLAYWWAEFAEHSWNRIGRQLIGQSMLLDMDRQARLFALINMDIYDIYLASLESKYYYDTWRPVTAIHNAHLDNNPYTDLDTLWQPEMVTPPWPEYPSAHAAVAAGGAEIVKEVLHTSKVQVRMASITAPDDMPFREIEDLDEAATECALSRIMNGYHFRFATNAGLDQGTHIARHITNHYLQAIRMDK